VCEIGDQGNFKVAVVVLQSIVKTLCKKIFGFGGLGEHYLMMKYLNDNF
jgi:hypothetical protein